MTRHHTKVELLPLLLRRPDQQRAASPKSWSHMAFSKRFPKAAYSATGCVSQRFLTLVSYTSNQAFSAHPFMVGSQAGFFNENSNYGAIFKMPLYLVLKGSKNFRRLRCRKNPIYSIFCVFIAFLGNIFRKIVKIS